MPQLRMTRMKSRTCFISRWIKLTLTSYDLKLRVKKPSIWGLSESIAYNDLRLISYFTYYPHTRIYIQIWNHSNRSGRSCCLRHTPCFKHPGRKIFKRC
uniref:Uncharacterized protein n=1 Tax=Megaselia scalaris TaxID=36166 RepID=T1GSF7_MEGSC